MTIDSDVADKAKKMAGKTGLPFKELINRALRSGLEELESPQKAKPYRTQGRSLGLKRGLSYDKVSELLALSEGEENR